ncbi:MAG: hypothetical protein DI637_07810 [Citromicrobium sp.]|nr:MAG: hypothetical protein DI637_07810 [Citromicrobium sp.]
MDLTTRYAQLVSWFSSNGTVPDTVLHIHGGMAIMLIVRVISGRSLATPWPVLGAIVAALLKEFADYLAYDTIKPDTFSDIAHTVFWPIVLFLGLRLRRARQSAVTQENGDPAPENRAD